MKHINKIKRFVVMFMGIFIIACMALSNDECIGKRCQEYSGGVCTPGVAVSGGCDESGLLGCVPKDCTGEYTPAIIDARCVPGDPSDICKLKPGSSMG